MAVNLVKKTDNKKILKLISVADSAIDWDQSYSEPGDLEDDEEIEIDDGQLPVIAENIPTSLLEQKKAHYTKFHDESKLKFKADDLPTLFAFAHPHRADVSRKMRELAAGMYSSGSKKDKGNKDMFTAVFDHFYLGMEQGFSGERQAVARINGRLTDDAVQALEDAEVFIELNAAFMNVYNQDRTKEKTRSEK